VDKAPGHGPSREQPKVRTESVTRLFSSRAILIACAVLLCPPAMVHAQRMYVTTLAGMPQYEGNTDGTNTDARFSYPWGVAVDRAGNLYVADSANLIRKLTPMGRDWVVTTLAGRTAGGGGWADGVGHEARFDVPKAIAVGRDGNLYVADSQYSVIRKLTPVGAEWVVTTLLEGPVEGGNPKRTSSLHQPHGVAVDKAGNVLVADSGNHRICKLVPAGAFWKWITLAGWPGANGHKDGLNEEAQFHYPYGLAPDGNGNIFVADYESSTIRKLTPSGTNWAVSTIAGTAWQRGSADGMGRQARFHRPSGIVVDPAGALLVADSENHAIRKLTPVGGDWMVTTVAGVAGELGFGDSAPVWQIAPAGKNWTVNTWPRGAEATDSTNDTGRFFAPQGLAIDGQGRVYVGDINNHAIRLCRTGLTWPPRLGVKLTTNQTVLSWPATGTEWVLETTRELIPRPDWRPLTNGLQVSKQTCVLTSGLPTRPIFFRFRHAAP